MSADSLENALVRVRSLLIDLERHIDKGATERDLAEVARAWIRASQIEQILRSTLPAEVIAEVGEVPEAPPHDSAGVQRDAGGRAR